MKAITYVLRLREPVLATQTASGEPNSATASPYLPGSMVRGAVLARLFPGQTLDSATTHRRFFDGSLRFLNAYPAHLDSSGKARRLLPTPLSWRVDKYLTPETEDKVFDLAVKKADHLKRPKAFSRDDEPRFIVSDLKEKHAQWRSPDQQLAVHNASDDRNEKRTGQSQVYRYQALAAGEMLAGAISGEETELKELREKLGDVLLLGGSRTGGYGLASIEINDVTDWQEYTPLTPAPEKVIITLLSDTVLRTTQGSFTNTLDGLLGATVLQSFAEMKVVGGFNRKWGLPLTQQWAISAGSVFVYEAAEVSTSVLENGIGERQAEGFGRVAVNWHTAPELLDQQLEQAAPKPVTLTSQSTAIAQRMADRQWRAILEAELVKKVVGLPLSHSLPSPAQMARVRLAARQALFEKKLDPVTEHLKSLFDTETQRPKRGAQQLSEAYVGNESLLTWLRKRALQPEIEYLATLERPKVAGVQARNTPELAAEYTARLIDGLLRRAIQQKKTQDRGGDHA